MIKHAAAPHRGVQFGKRDLRAIGVVEQVHMPPRFAEIHASDNRSLVPYIVVADDDDYRARHAR